LPFSSCSIVPRIASARFTWPPIMFVHVGELESSKSAMKPEAPELRALMTIFRLVGPVISTRRFCSASGSGAIVQSPSRTACEPARKSSVPPASSSFWRSTRAASSSRRVGSSSR
jgi:hypothetical protein